jgi:hypothetical protein
LFWNIPVQVTVVGINACNEVNSADPMLVSRSAPLKKGHLRHLLFKFPVEYFIGANDAAGVYEGCELWPRERFHEFVTSRRLTNEPGLAHVALMVSDVVLVEHGMRWLRNKNHTLPPSKARQVDVFLPPGTHTWGNKFAIFLSFEAVAAHFFIFTVSCGCSDHWSESVSSGHQRR